MSQRPSTALSSSWYVACWPLRSKPITMKLMEKLEWPRAACRGSRSARSDASATLRYPDADDEQGEWQWRTPRR